MKHENESLIQCIEKAKIYKRPKYLFKKLFEPPQTQTPFKQKDILRRYFGMSIACFAFWPINQPAP